MKIAKCVVRAVKVPMTPHNTAAGSISISPLILLTVITDQGVKGNSITFTYTPAALKPAVDLTQNLAEMVCGQELLPAAATDALAGRFRLLGTQGLVGMAIAGIDMALWDAYARSLQQPLYKVLGGGLREIPAYGGIGYDGESGSAAAAEAWVKKGLLGVKAKIGYPTLKEDLAVIHAMRAAVGPDISVMVDYNQSLTPIEASRRLRVLQDEQLVWIEEPVLAHDYRALARLADEVRVPLQAGENWWGPLDFAHALEAGIRGNFMPDVMKVGGVTGWMRVASLAQAQGIDVSNHLWPEISAQLLLATPTAAWLEYADWWNPVLKEPLSLSRGRAVPNDVLGCGVEFDDKKVQQYSA
jgi:mandelate racemase